MKIAIIGAGFAGLVLGRALKDISGEAREEYTYVRPKSNHRLSMIYKTYVRMDVAKKTAIAHDGEKFLSIF